MQFTDRLTWVQAGDMDGLAHFVIFVIFLSHIEHLIGYNTAIRLPLHALGK